jgi:hypothetical protein
MGGASRKESLPAAILRMRLFCRKVLTKNLSRDTCLQWKFSPGSDVSEDAAFPQSAERKHAILSHGAGINPVRELVSVISKSYLFR